MSVENITFYPAKNATLNITQLRALALYACGHPVKVISEKLGNADPTINNHLVLARHHYRASNTTQAACTAIACGDIKFKYLSSYSTTLRCNAVLCSLFLALICYLDTPFTSSEDQDVTRHNGSQKKPTHTQNSKAQRKEIALDDFYLPIT